MSFQEVPSYPPALLSKPSNWLYLPPATPSMPPIKNKQNKTPMDSSLNHNTLKNTLVFPASLSFAFFVLKEEFESDLHNEASSSISNLIPVYHSAT